METSAFHISHCQLPKPALEDEPGLWRIGLLALASDAVVERDFRLMLGSEDRVRVFCGRVRNAQSCTVVDLAGMLPRIADGAADVASASTLHVMAFGCTSATPIIGFHRIAEAIGQARPDIPVTTPYVAAEAALQALGVRRISVLAPYIPQVSDIVIRALERSGYEIVASASLGLEYEEEFPRVGRETLLEAAAALDDPAAEAIFISCTAVRAAEIVERLEERTGKPVLSGNQALLWHALRLVGCPFQASGYGRLFEL